MQLVLRIVLAFMIAFGGTLSNAMVHAWASPCEHESVVEPADAASDDCSATAPGHVDHKADHCVVMFGGGCAPLQSAPSFKAPVTTTADVDWLAPVDRALLGRTFEPATPPPRA